VNEELTTEEITELENWLRTQSVANMHVERPRTLSIGLLGSGDVEGYLGGGVRLSEETRAREEAILQKKKKHREAVEKRRRKLKRGQRHHKSKAATKRRQREKRWATQPLKSLTFGFGVWNISQEEWDRTLGQCWLLYSANDLSVKRSYSRGTKDDPYTIYGLKVVHRKHGVIYDGRDQWIYDHSSPNELDIEKAPEGALLFTSERLTLKELAKHLYRQYVLSIY
jgi:hypothetical protein